MSRPELEPIDWNIVHQIDALKFKGLVDFLMENRVENVFNPLKWRPSSIIRRETPRISSIFVVPQGDRYGTLNFDNGKEISYEYAKLKWGRDGQTVFSEWGIYIVPQRNTSRRTILADNYPSARSRRRYL